MDLGKALADWPVWLQGYAALSLHVSAMGKRRSADQCLLRYQLAVTQRKEEEPSSTSVFNQNDPWTPTVDFADFLNNETIAGEVS